MSTDPYDVFISYHESNEPWVCSELRRPLENARLRVYGEWAFAGGLDKIVAREEAVEQSRHTLVVMSKAWCASSTHSSDARLARFIDSSSRGGKLLPLRLEEDVEPPRSIAMLVIYDFSKPDRRRASLAKLLRDLGRSRETVDEVLSRDAGNGIAALGKLMRDRSVCAAVDGVKDTLSDAYKDMEELNRYKKLHELFQQAESEFQLLQERKAPLLSEVEEQDDWHGRRDLMWRKLEALINNTLNAALVTLVSYARARGFPPVHILWIGTVERARQELLQASEQRDVKLLKSGAERLFRVLGEEPNKLNSRLFNGTERLLLGRVVEKLESIRDTLNAAQFDQEARECLEEFEKGIFALIDLHKSLDDIVTNHNCLQSIDNSLRPLDSPDVSVEDIQNIWPDLTGSLETLRVERGAEWELRFLMARDELSQTLNDFRPQAPGSKAERHKQERKIRSCFFTFRGNVRIGFNQVDIGLLKFCEQLQREVGESLERAIRRLQQ